jgi:hypothetical protein
MTATSNRCMVSDSYERVDMHGNEADFELALKGSSATAFIGMLHFTFPSNADVLLVPKPVSRRLVPVICIDAFPLD